MKCIVFGGGGFIGSHLSESLIEEGNQVTIFDKPSARYMDILSKKGAKIIKGNFLDTADLKNSIEGVETIFHLSSTTVPKNSNINPIFDIESNLIGTVKMLTVAKDLGVKKIIYASSGGTIYGIPREIPIDENHPTNPICSYGIIKLAVEKYIHLFWTLYGLDYRILRISNAYGERAPINPNQGIIPMIVSNSIKDEEIHIWGDGTVIRDYIYISDIVRAFLKVNVYNGESRIFNIGSGIGSSINDLINIIKSIMDKPLKVSYQHREVYDVPINILNITRSKELLNWQPKINIHDGISRTIEYIVKLNEVK